MSPRAPAMTPPRRRAELVEVTTQLLRSLREVPTTQHIAARADVAEGTIFRAFGTKDELLSAVVERAFCPAPLLRALADVDAASPLGQRLVAIATAYQQRYLEVFEILVALGLTAPPRSRGAHHACTIESGHVPDEPVPDEAGTDEAGTGLPGPDLQERVATATTDLVAPDADLLRCSPRELVDMLRVMVFAGSHTELTHGATMTPARLADVLLNGMAIRPDLPTTTTTAPTTVPGMTP